MSQLVEFKCPQKLVNDFDETVKRLGFTNRSEALRTIMRNLVEKNKKEEAEN